MLHLASADFVGRDFERHDSTQLPLDSKIERYPMDFLGFAVLHFKFWYIFAIISDPEGRFTLCRVQIRNQHAKLP